MSLPKTVRGRRPNFHASQGVDEAITMILTLAQEFVVLRERFDSAERVAASHGIALKNEVEALVPDEELLREREAWRQAFFARLFHYAQQRRSEMAEQYTDEWYLKTLADIADAD